MATNREQFLKKHGLPMSTSLSKTEISKLSGVPIKALDEVYDRGLAAHKNNLSSVRLLSDFSKNPDIKKFPESARLSPQQWGFGRIFAFVMKTPKVYYDADNDIRIKYKLK
jgi:hypothetical protein